jgi:hypothetical protein
MCGHRVSAATRRSVGGAFLHKQRQAHLGFKVVRRVVVYAEEEQSSWSELEIEVPKDQRPINELEQLKTSFLYSWGTLETSEYVKRMTLLWSGMFALVGGPIAFQTFAPTEQPLEFALSATTGSLIVVAIANLRIFLGWKYVSDRLMTATLPYEETGWYDGQFFVKPPEILARDRLLGMYQTRPVLNKLRTTLQGTGALLLACTIFLAIAISASSDADGVYGRGASRITPDGVIFSSKVNSMNELLTDDEAAAEEAAAQGNKPGYCRDRYFKAVSGSGAACGN